jgi:competence protein ComEC
MPLLWLSIAFLFGILLGRALQFPAGFWLAGLLIFGFLGWIESRFGRRLLLEERWRSISPLPLAVILAAVILGAWRYPLPEKWGTSELAFFNETEEITLVGRIITMPEEGDRTSRFYLRAESRITADGNEHPLDGKALIETASGAGWKYGDRIRITGVPETPPEDETFSYREYLAHQGVYTLFSYPFVDLIESRAGNLIVATLFSFRQRAQDVIFHILPQPEAALLSGILLGLDNDIPVDVEAAFRETGTAHIIAISGFNIAIVAVFFYWIFRRITLRWNAAVLTIVFLFLYSLFVGWQPSVVRAAIMGSMAILGNQIGRKGAGLNTLALTAAVMCFFDPYLPWNISFQLSFTATMGLILLGDPLQHWFSSLIEKRLSTEKAKLIAQPVGEYFLLTLAAQIATLPVIAFQFQRISLIALIANPLILPFQPLLMVLGAFASLIGIVFLPLGRLMGFLVLPLASYTINTVEWLARLPGELQIGSIPAWLIIGLYLIGFALLTLRGKLKNHLTPAVILIGTSLVTAVLWRGVLARPDRNLHLILPGLENSSAVMLQTPGGKMIMINGAVSSSQLTNALEQHLSVFDRELDGLFITDNKATTITGLISLAENIPVHRVYWGAAVPSSRTARRLESSLRSTGADSLLLEEGQEFELENGILLRVLENSKDGTALLLRYGKFKALIPGGISEDDLRGEVYLSSGVTLVILSAQDQVEENLGAWKSLNPMAFIWIDLNVLPRSPEWISTNQSGDVEVITDGERINFLGAR